MEVLQWSPKILVGRGKYGCITTQKEGDDSVPLPSLLNCSNTTRKKGPHALIAFFVTLQQHNKKKAITGCRPFLHYVATKKGNSNFVVVIFFFALQKNKKKATVAFLAMLHGKKKKVTTTLLPLPSSFHYKRKKRQRSKEDEGNDLAVTFFSKLWETKKRRL